MRAKRFVAGLTILALLVFAGCSGTKKSDPVPDPTKTPTTPAKQPVELLIWSKFQNEIEVVKTLSEQWAKETGNKVTVLYFEQGFQEFLTIAAAGKGPDVYFGVPHDNLGTFQKAGLLDPVPNGVMNNADYPKVALDAVTYDGKLFAVPVTMEAAAMIYNKALVPTPPKTYNDFLKVAKEKGFAYKARDFYFSWGFIGGSGGYVFQNKGGTLDPKSVGFATDGGKAGLQLVSDLVHVHKLMPADAEYDYMQGRFEAGKIGMMLNGPWGIDGAKKANIDVAVAPMPTLPNGQPFNPFVGVFAGFVPSATTKRDAAWDYMKFMLDKAPLDLFKAGSRLPANTKLQAAAEVKADALAQGFISSANNGTPMPNIPEMSQIWDPGATMLSVVLDQKATVDLATTNAVKAINERIDAMK